MLIEKCLCLPRGSFLCMADLLNISFQLGAGAHDLVAAAQAFQAEIHARAQDLPFL